MRQHGERVSRATLAPASDRVATASGTADVTSSAMWAST
jgi:hypothetical protein